MSPPTPGPVADQQPTVLFVVGPTASGKSDLAVEIAEALALRRGSTSAPGDGPDGVWPAPEIINTDSVQFFAGVDIGAAKPGPELLARARHHLIGHRPLGSTYTAGQFREDALRLIANGGPGATWLAAGGSGFYVQALEKGMFDVPEVVPATKAQLSAESMAPNGWPTLYRELTERDPRAAAKIAPADRYRILRALEILRSHAGTLTEIRDRFAICASGPPPFRVKKVGLFVARDVLRERIMTRTRHMLARGLIDEVRALRAELGATAADWAPLRSVGYREVGAYLDGRLDRTALEPEIITSTMQLAKRQMTWFKRDASIVWYASEKGFRDAIAGVVASFEV